MESITASTITGIVSLLAPTFFVIAVVSAGYYTKSRHLPLRRIWQLMHGAEEIKDVQIQKFIDEQSSLIAFRFYSGVTARSLKDAQQLIRWAEANDIEMVRLRACGQYFDPKTRIVRADAFPSRSKLLWQFFRLMASTLLAVFCIWGTYPSHVLFSFKGTNRFFLATATEARPLWPWNTGVLRSIDCSTRPPVSAKNSPFTKLETDLMCQVFGASDTVVFVKQQLRVQRSMLCAFALILTIAAFSCIAALSRAATAKALLKQNINPALEAEPIPFTLEY